MGYHEIDTLCHLVIEQRRREEDEINKARKKSTPAKVKSINKSLKRG